MVDINAIIIIIPPILTAAFAYLVARKKNIITERIGKAKIEFEVQVQALSIVEKVMAEVRIELRREIDDLRKENESLKKVIVDSQIRIDSLESQLDINNQLISTLKSEIAALQIALSMYKEENIRLKTK
jgi:chromosome segregation ATPase